MAKPAHPFFCKAQEEKPVAELCPDYKYGLFIMVPIAPGSQVEEVGSISSYFEARTVFLSIPNLCHPLNKRITALYLRDHLIVGIKRSLKLAQIKRRLS